MQDRLSTAMAVVTGTYEGPKPVKVGPFFIGNWYETFDGSLVQIVGASTKYPGYETVYDQHGHHRYARSTPGSIDHGRLTASFWDDPGNIPLFLGEEPEFCKMDRLSKEKKNAST